MAQTHATVAQYNGFISYLNEQANVMTIGSTTYGQPYVWGGQHLHLTPSNYQSVIHNRESGRGGYKDGTTYEAAAKAYCKRLFDHGATDLYAYDCSGLGMYYWQNVTGVFSGDANANMMMGRTKLYKDTPEKGWWVFHVNSNGRATHIGYMVDDTHVVEARGRKYGVVKRTFKKKDWDKWGIPKILEEVIPPPGTPHPGHILGYTSRPTTCGHPEEATSSLRIKVLGGKKRTVNIRKGPSTDFPVILVAHGGDLFPLVTVSPTTGWYKIITEVGVGYITNLTKYTDMEAIIV